MEAYVLQLILCGAWLTGLLLLGVSLQATKMLNEPRPILSEGERRYEVTVYTAPWPFEGDQGHRQTLAINSWLKLVPCPKIVLLGRHPSLHAFADSSGPNVTVEAEIDFTFLGSPFFHSMVARARASDADVALLVDPEVVLLQNLMEAVESMLKLNGDWMLVGMSRSVPTFPFSLKSPSDMWSDDDGGAVEAGEVLDYVTETAVWDECGGSRLWMWNVGLVPLHAGVMPPFVYGQGQHNDWLLNEILTSGFRTVVDGSEAISIIRPQKLPNASTAEVDKVDDSEVLLRHAKWESESNSQLSILYGSFLFKRANFSNIPVKLDWCGGSLCFLKASEKPVPCLRNQARLLTEGLNSQRASVLRLSLPGISTSSSNSAGWNPIRRRQLLLDRGHRGHHQVHRGHHRAHRHQFWINDMYIRGSGYWDRFADWIQHEGQQATSSSSKCNTIQRERKVQCDSPDLEGSPIQKSNLAVPFSWDSLVRMAANEDKVVILAVVGNSYRGLLMSWVCRLRVLGISNFVISALDEDLYQFSVQQGLPVFRDGHAMNVSRNDCHFGTKCFQKVTKVKSRTVLQILQLGYNVLFSDVDVYWFQDPIRSLMFYGPGNLAAQTDQYNTTFPDNEPRRLNSGFYFAWSDPKTIAAFEMIVKHAAKSEMSEQPSFYDVLCGYEGKNRVGDATCWEPQTQLTVHFLDKDQFPNGAYAGIWEKKDVKKACRKRGCLVLHNNWINGRLKKVHRQIRKGLWQYDVSSRMCIRDWQGPKSAHAY